MAFLKKFWEGWKKFGHFMGDLIGRLVLTLFYFTLFLPFGLIVRFFMDPLHIKHIPTAWQKRITKDKTIEEARRLA